MTDIKLNQFNGAVRECLEMCYQSRNWLATMATFKERLRADGWATADVEEVAAVVRRILRGIVYADPAPPGSDAAPFGNFDRLTAAP